MSHTLGAILEWLDYCYLVCVFLLQSNVDIDAFYDGLAALGSAQNVQVHLIDIFWWVWLASARALARGWRAIRNVTARWCS